MSRRVCHRPALVAIACAVLACTSGDDTAADTSTQSSAADTGTTAPASSTGAAVESSTGAPTGDGILQCTRTCEVPFDCCAPNTPGCPGAYPHNVACEDGYCRTPGCSDDDECAAVLAGQVCRPVRGVPTCVTPCSDDTPCAAPGPGGSCTGETDAGEAFCFTRCDDPGEFCGSQSCDAASGLCVCASSGVCQVDWECID